MISVTDRTTVSIGLATVVLLAMALGGVAMPVAAQEDIDSERMEVTVAEDGTVEWMEVSLGMDVETYEEYEAYAEWEGYEQVDDWFEAIYDEEDWIDDSSVMITEVAGGYVVSIELVDIDTNDVPEVDISAEGETVTYEEFDVPNPADDSDVSEVVYQLNMPGEISDSNADEVDGDVATWNLHEEHTSELFVEATVSDEDADAGDDDESERSDDGVDGDDGDDGMPGFGGIVAIVGLCLATALAVGRRPTV